MSLWRAATFLWAASARNRVRRQLERLRQPKYVVGLLVGLAYLYLTMLRHMRPGGVPAAPGALGPLVPRVVLLGLGVALVLGAWTLGPSRPALTFSEAEVQHLFPAPVGRRALVAYRLTRSLLRALVGALFTALFLSRTATRHPLLYVAGATLTLFLGQLHVVAASLVRTRLAERGREWVRWVGALVFAAAVLAALGHVVWYHPLPERPEPFAVADWLGAVLRSPALAWLVRPLSLAVAPPLAQDGAGLLRALPGALALVALHLVWIRVMDVPFEEAAAEAAESRAKARLSRRRGGRALKLSRAPFALAGGGRPELALVWKNLTAARRAGGLNAIWGLLLGAGLLAAVFVLDARRSGEAPWGVLALVAAGTAGALALMGPSTFRVDLRMDLRRLDLLRALPLSGRQVVAGALAAPALALAAVELVLLGLGLGLGLAARTDLLTRPERVAVALALAPLLPTLTLAGLLVQNGAAVLFPAWLPPDGVQSRGIEALGQRLLTLVGTLLVLAAALLPAALVGGLLAAALWGLLGTWVLPLVGLVGSGVMLAVCGVGVALLGRAFERMDVSLEGAEGETA